MLSDETIVILDEAIKYKLSELSSMKLYLDADTKNFYRIKQLAHDGHLRSLNLVWSWRHFNFIFRAEYIPIVELMAPILQEIQLSWLKFQNAIAKSKPYTPIF